VLSSRNPEGFHIDKQALQSKAFIAGLVYFFYEGGSRHYFP
jgi:hypothetical protein